MTKIVIIMILLASLKLCSNNSYTTEDSQFLPGDTSLLEESEDIKELVSEEIELIEGEEIFFD